MEIKRLLCIVGSMNAGGAESFLMKVYRRLDRTKYQMDFAVTSDGIYDDEIISLGGRIHRITPKSRGIIKNYKSIEQLVKKNAYQYVMRVSQNAMSSLELLAARQGGARVLAFRSSNSKTIGGRLDAAVHQSFRPLARHVANVKIAPSTEAAEFMFGKDCVERQHVVLLHNGLDLERYRYCPQDRAQLRSALCAENALVLGHIGRFNRQKNHKFLLDVFSEVKKRRPDALLLLIGQGELEAEMKQQTQQLGLTDAVRFLGVRSDVPQLLSAMDVLVFPSFYEGMPNVVVEAQATGLPCVIADTITPEADLTGLVEYLPLDTSPADWAETVIRRAEQQRQDTGAVLIAAGYDIDAVCAQFEQTIFG